MQDDETPTSPRKDRINHVADVPPSRTSSEPTKRGLRASDVITPILSKSVVVTLWNLTKKYEAALKHHEVLAVKESEIDREEVADAYRILETPWERVLDGRFYWNLALMQLRRDVHLTVPDMTAEEWISQFAVEVKRRATPLVFLISREASIPPFSLPEQVVPLAQDKAPTSDDRSAVAKYRVNYQQLSYDELDVRRIQLADRLQGKRFSLYQLSAQLSNWELDLLSQMIRDGDLPAVFLNPTTLVFRTPKRKKEDEILFGAAPIEVQRRQKVQRQ